MLMCFMWLVWLPGVRRFASLIVLGAQMDAIGPMDIHSSGHLDSPLKCLHVMVSPRDADDPDDANASEAVDSPEAVMSPGDVSFL